MQTEQDFWLPALALEPRSREPLYLQLRRQMADAIRRNPPQGARLPSTRVLAKLLGTSRNTVIAAYEILAADGLIDGARGSGTRVRADSGVRGIRALGLRRILRDAHYPARTAAIVDPDGNTICLNF